MKPGTAQAGSTGRASTGGVQCTKSMLVATGTLTGSAAGAAAGEEEVAPAGRRQERVGLVGAARDPGAGGPRRRRRERCGGRRSSRGVRVAWDALRDVGACVGRSTASARPEATPATVPTTPTTTTTSAVQASAPAAARCARVRRPPGVGPPPVVLRSLRPSRPPCGVVPVAVRCPVPSPGPPAGPTLVGAGQDPVAATAPDVRWSWGRTVEISPDRWGRPGKCGGKAQDFASAPLTPRRARFK